MRKSGGLLIPLSIILAYYAILVFGMLFLLNRFPGLAIYFPSGGVAELAQIGGEFEPVYSGIEERIFSDVGPIRLLVASFGAILLAVPVSWVYFITGRVSNIEQSFLTTIMIMPVVVTGIAMVVVNSIALAFSLAGIVAAVRFRFTLRQPSDAMYIFVAIGIGLSSGIGALGIACVISFSFVMCTLTIWKLEYGKTLAGPFLTTLTRRDLGEDEYN